jgi:hypothetical protein
MKQEFSLRIKKLETERDTYRKQVQDEQTKRLDQMKDKLELEARLKTAEEEALKS